MRYFLVLVQLTCCEIIIYVGLFLLTVSLEVLLQERMKLLRLVMVKLGRQGIIILPMVITVRFMTGGAVV